METAPPESGVQLAAIRAVIGSCGDSEQLRQWLDGHGLPQGVVIDLGLRWKILVRLATLGALDRRELASWLDRETTTEATVHHTRALASLPDEEAKAFAWDRFSGGVEASPYDLEAAGLGMWHRGQEQLTAPYVDRYFTEIAGTVDVRSGWVLTEAAHNFFPRFSLDRSTLGSAERVLADDSLDVGLRRALVDETDELRRGLHVRDTFGS